MHNLPQIPHNRPQPAPTHGDNDARETSDPSFVDILIPRDAGRNERLDRLIDWPKVARILDGVHAAFEGRPAYPPLMMVKIIVLQQWYDASDVGMEEALFKAMAHNLRRADGLRAGCLAHG